MNRPTTDKFRLAAEATGGNISKMAGIFGVTRSTIYQWLKRPAYGAIIEEQRGAMVDEAIEAARWLATGRAMRDDEGNFLGWIERPDGQTLRWLLGTFGKREGFVNEVSVSAKVNLENLTEAQLDEVVKRLVKEMRNQEPVPAEEPEKTLWGKEVTQFSDEI